MNDKTLALLNEVTNSLADDIEDFSCGELRQALYRAIAQREEAATRIEALEAEKAQPLHIPTTCKRNEGFLT